MLAFDIPEDGRMLLDSIDRSMEQYFPPSLIRQHDEPHEAPPEAHAGLGRIAEQPTKLARKPRKPP